MRPAFSSTRQAALFALLLLVLIAAPALLAATDWFDRQNVYPAMSGEFGAYPWIQQQIFVERSDVDIAFVGSSRLWTAVNAPYVQQQLSARLNRQSDVLTLGWNWPGYDQLYVVTRDLLEHRRVHMLVVYDDIDAFNDVPHPLLYRELRFGEAADAFESLPFSLRARAYGGAVLGLPRNLLSLIRPDEVEYAARWGNIDLLRGLNAADLTAQRGSLRARSGFGNPRQPFVRYAPPPPPSAVVVASGAVADAVSYVGPAAGPYQRHFARLLALLCNEYGVQLVALHLPTIAERDATTIPEREPLVDLMEMPVDLVGISGTRLFANVPAADMQKLYYNQFHLNQNGQDLFTSAVTPALLRLYVTAHND